MKHLLACLMALALLLSCVALAEASGKDMVVVNCEEWVSLRAEPSTSARRLAKVPLDQIVTHCAPSSNGFTYCEYQGQGGYILTEYLEALPGNVEDAFDDSGDGDDEDYNSEIALDQDVGGAHILAVRQYGESEETMTVTATDAATGEQLWTRTVRSGATELTNTTAFPGGTADAPLLIMCSSQGIAAADPRSGEVRWSLSPDQTGLSGGWCHLVAADGTMYLGGYYGPDPVAIDAQGGVLWRADAQDDDTFWLYEMEIRDNVLAAHYDHLIDEDAGWVYYDLATGEKLGMERE